VSVIAAHVTATHILIELAAFIGGGYGMGEFLGKAAALIMALDERDYWSDLSAVVGGCLGVVLCLFVILGTVSA
jgi:hypothetical protein